MSPRALAAALAVLLVAPAVHAAGVVIPPGREQKAQALLGDVGFMRDLGDGYRFDGISLGGSTVVYTLSRRGQPAGELLLTPAAGARAGDLVTKSFAVERRPIVREARASALLDAAARSVAAHDDEPFYIAAEKAPPKPGDAPRPRDPIAAIERPAALAGFVARAAAALAVTLAGVALILRRLRPAWVVTDFKPIHLIPACVQLTLFTYWGVYWAPLRAYAPVIALQIVFAYLVDALVSLWARRKLVVGLAPLPVVLSINLFVQFSLRDIHLAFAAIALAFLSKAWIRRGGGHVFNPSALGITVVGFVELLSGEHGGGDVSPRFALPPNMTELILVLALLPQSRRPIALVSLFAALGIGWVHAATGAGPFHPGWAPVALAIALLATDPATIPRTGPGRALFGVMLGGALVATGVFLDATGHSDFYGKVIPVPFMNLLTPWCDRVGARLGAGAARWLAPRWNGAHMAAWFAVMAYFVHSGVKEAVFSPAEHEAAGTPLIQRDAAGAITCQANPTFCQPFTFAAEITLWARRPQAETPGVNRAR